MIATFNIKKQLYKFLLWTRKITHPKKYNNYSYCRFKLSFCILAKLVNRVTVLGNCAYRGELVNYAFSSKAK